MTRHEPIVTVAKPAWKFVVPLVLLATAFGFFWWPASILCGLLAAYVLYFFRDPRRRVPNIPGAMVSPADGKVVSVTEVPCERLPEGRAWRIAIFLNIFNVHIQRASHEGNVFAIERKPGKYINALNDKCSEENEQVTVWLQNEDGVFGIRQIAGAIARRIVVSCKEGDRLERGERYGLIQFGSRVELFVPMTATIKVKPGQHVRGGENCIALLNEEQARKGRYPSSDSRIEREEVIAEVG